MCPFARSKRSGNLLGVQQSAKGKPVQARLALTAHVRAGSRVGPSVPRSCSSRRFNRSRPSSDRLRQYPGAAALNEAGSGLHDIVRTRVILTDIDNRKEAIEARKLFCRDSRPVDTIMAVTRFVNPE